MNVPNAASLVRRQLTLALSLLSLTACVSGRPGKVRPAETIFFNATFLTEDPGHPTAEAVAVQDGIILAIGTRSAVFAHQGPETRRVDLHGATVFPGFIDTHSHLMGYAIFDDPAHWLDVSNENLLFKPAPGDPRCSDPKNPQVCFIPAVNEDEVFARLAGAVKAAPSGTTPILAFGHDVARLGPSKAPPGQPECVGFGFACPNLQDGHARETLDKISPTHPIFISASSGHFGYVNSPALHLLNICGTQLAGSHCHPPAEKPAAEAAQADRGELVEDLALYAPGFFEGQIFKKSPAELVEVLHRGVLVYRQHGFTVVQEGAASDFQLAIYKLATHLPDFPVSVVVLAYAGTAKFEESVAIAQQARKDHEGDPSFIVGGIKTFADGSTQGYSASLGDPYTNVYPPLTAPWYGSPDHDAAELTREAAAAHAAGFPLAIHMNGDRGIEASLTALEASHDPKIRDLVIHFQISNPNDVARVKKLRAGLTFLIPDLYYYGVPFRQQILGCERAAKAFPLGDAVRAGLTFGLHSDSPVTPPDPLFMIWEARTRAFQQPPWLPKAPAEPCPAEPGAAQTLSIAQGVRAFTIDAASFYGLESRLGSLAVGKAAEMTILSRNPLEMEDKPDELKTIRVLGTVHRGRHFPNPDAERIPVWPG
jgi:predicted amidohydrolase YtcJ